MKYEFSPDDFGPLRIWKEPDPVSTYVIGVDTAEGIEGGDYSCAFVIDADTREHVATWHGLMDPMPFASEVATLGRAYNNALVISEVNNHGQSVIRELIHTHEYPNLYKRKCVATKDSARTKTTWEYGFVMSAKTKPVVVDTLRSIVRHKVVIRDSRFTTEALTWVLDAMGRPKTNPGANDDCLIAAGLAHYAANEHFGPLHIPRAVTQLTKGAEKARVRKAAWKKILDRVEKMSAEEEELVEL